MIKLTNRQAQILRLIRDTIVSTGFPPTRVEISTAFGFKSANAAEEHLRSLARKDLIELTPGISRGIRLSNLGTVFLSQLDTLDPVDSASSSITSNLLSKLKSDLQFPFTVPLLLPLVGRVAAGSPILSEGHIENTYSVDPSFFSAKPDYLLKVRGMSMRDAGICDGDFLAVKKSTEAANGQIVVARLGDEMTVKRLQRNGPLIELHPENPDFCVIKIDSEDFALEGLAVGLVRSWN